MAWEFAWSLQRLLGGVWCSGFFPSTLGCLGNGDHCSLSACQTEKVLGGQGAKGSPRQPKEKKAADAISFCHTHSARGGKSGAINECGPWAMALSGVGRFAYLAGARARAGAAASPHRKHRCLWRGLECSRTDHGPPPHFFPVAQARPAR